MYTYILFCLILTNKRQKKKSATRPLPPPKKTEDITANKIYQQNFGRKEVNRQMINKIADKRKLKIYIGSESKA